MTMMIIAAFSAVASISFCMRAREALARSNQAVAEEMQYPAFHETAAFLCAIAATVLAFTSIMMAASIGSHGPQ